MWPGGSGKDSQRDRGCAPPPPPQPCRGRRSTGAGAGAGPGRPLWPRAGGTISEARALAVLPWPRGCTERRGGAGARPSALRHLPDASRPQHCARGSSQVQGQRRGRTGTRVCPSHTVFASHRTRSFPWSCVSCVPGDAHTLPPKHAANRACSLPTQAQAASLTLGSQPLRDRTLGPRGSARPGGPADQATRPGSGRHVTRAKGHRAACRLGRPRSSRSWGQGHGLQQGAGRTQARGQPTGPPLEERPRLERCRRLSLRSLAPLTAVMKTFSLG